MPNYPYTFQLPPLNVQDIPNDGVAGEFLGINGSGVLDWLTAGGAGDMLKADNLSGLASYPTARTNLGLGTGDSPTFANLTLTSPSLVSSAPVTISQTWNGTGSTVFKALVVNATTPGTTSSSSSLLLDLQVGGSSVVKINKLGQFVSGAGGQFLDLGGSDAYLRNISSGRAASLWADECRVVGGPLVFSDSINVNISNISAGVALYKEAANTLALRNGANAQTFNVYGTYTSGTSYERLTLSAPSAANAIIGTNKGSGGGTARGLEFQTDGVSRWSISTAGHLLAAADNTYDIGAGGANRPRYVYAGSGFAAVNTVDAPYIRAGSTGGFQIQGRFFIGSAADGNIYITNNAVNDFGRLQFGGTTNLFPAIKRSSTTLQVRLADDTAFAPIQGKLTTDTAYTGTVVAATGYITIYDSTGTAYRVPCAV